jgi:hypothetical protein
VNIFNIQHSPSYFSLFRGERCRLACRTYPAKVASATKAGNSGTGTVACFNTPWKEDQTLRKANRLEAT